MIPGAQQPLRFDGPAYDAAKDRARLTGQAARVFNCVKDGRWRSLPELHEATGEPEASISAQLRHFRKPRFGAHTVNKRRRTDSGGLWEYQLIVNKEHTYEKATAEEAASPQAQTL